MRDKSGRTIRWVKEKEQVWKTQQPQSGCCLRINKVVVQSDELHSADEIERLEGELAEKIDKTRQAI